MRAGTSSNVSEFRECGVRLPLVKTLEVRRHSLTKKGPGRDRGSLLSAEGIQRARRLGDVLPAMSYVLTGPDRRHVETAIAMGYPVDELVDWPSGYVSGVVDHHDQWRWERPFVRYGELIGSKAALQQVVSDHLTHWRRAIDQIEDGAAALVVSSGGRSNRCWSPHSPVVIMVGGVRRCSTWRARH